MEDHRDAASSPWKLADAKPGEELDNAKASGGPRIYRRDFRRCPFARRPITETGLDKPSTVRLETFDNFTYELRIGN